MSKFTVVIPRAEQLKAISEQAKKDWSLVYAHAFDIWDDGKSYVALTFEKEI